MQSAYMVSAPELRSSRHGDFPAEAIGSWLMGQARRRRPRRPACHGPPRPWSRPRRARAISRSGRSTAKIVPDQLVDNLRPRRTGAGAGDRRLQQRRDPLARASWRRRRRPTRPPMRRRSASATAISPTNSCGSTRPAIWPRRMLAAAARRALRLDGRAAGARSRPRSARRASSIYFDHGYPAADGARPARLPRRRNSLCVRQHPAVPRRPGRRCRTRRRSGRCRTRCSATGRASRRAACRAPRASRPGGLMATSRAYMAFAGTPRPGTQPAARHVRVQRAGGLPPPCAGRHPLELERRHRLAAAPRRSARMPMNDGEMQSFSLTLDKFLRHAARWHPRAEVVTAREDGRIDRIGYAALMERSLKVSARARRARCRSRAIVSRPSPGTARPMSRPGMRSWGWARSATRSIRASPRPSSPRWRASPKRAS